MLALLITIIFLTCTWLWWRLSAVSLVRTCHRLEHSWSACYEFPLWIFWEHAHQWWLRSGNKSVFYVTQWGRNTKANIWDLQICVVIIYWVLYFEHSISSGNYCAVNIFAELTYSSNLHVNSLYIASKLLWLYFFLFKHHTFYFLALLYYIWSSVQCWTDVEGAGTLTSPVTLEDKHILLNN
jgi:hypothetical protein